MIWVERSFDTSRVEVWMANSIGGRSPLRNEFGTVIDFNVDLRLAGGPAAANAIWERLQRADEIFSTWGRRK